MLSAIFSFLGGTAFRLIWGQVSEWVNKKQDHQFELDRLRAQEEIDAAAHARNLEAIRVQSELNIKVIEVQGNVDLSKLEYDAWSRAIDNAGKPTGIFIVDLWNGIIRPAAATVALSLWVIALARHGWVVGDWDKDMIGVTLGFFFASRVLTKK